MCPICRTPFHKPVTTKNCGHTFCATCLSRAVEIQPICPIDRQPLTYRSDELCNTLLITSQLDRLEVKCPNRSCKHVAPRGSISYHYERECEHTMVNCPDPTCSDHVARGDAGPERGCLHRDVPCRYCSKMVQIAGLEDHYDRDCIGHTAKCTHCNAIVVRHRIQAHLASDCPEAEIRCKWRPFGCTLATKRKIVREHERNGCVFEAIGTLVKERLEDRTIINQLTDRLATMETRMQQMELRSERRASRSSPGMQGWPPFPGGSTGIPDLNLNSGPGSTHSSSYQFESPDDYMLNQFERLGSSIEVLRKKLTEVDGRHSMMLLEETRPLKEQMADLRSNIGIFGMHTAWLMNAWRRQMSGQGAGQNGASSGGGGGGGGSGGGRGEADNGDERHHYRPSRRMSENRGEHRGEHRSEHPPRL